MREILVALLQNPTGICLAALMVFTILTFVIWYGFYVIALPAVSLVSAAKVMLAGYSGKTIGFAGNGGGAYLAANPQLGITMADGGDDRNRKKESTHEN